MGENESISNQNKSIEIYSARVTLRKKDGKKKVRVQIREFKKGRTEKIDLPFPEEIDERDLQSWKSYGGEQDIVYNRKGRLDYLDVDHYSKVPMDMAQRLEELVRRALK